MATIPIISEARKTWGAPTERWSASLKEAFTSQVDAAGLAREEKLSSTEPRRNCRTFVLALRASDMRIPVRLRSYQSRMDSATKQCTIWEAARATTAFPEEFLPIKIGPMGVSYVSAGLGFSNPAKEALDEAARIWHLHNIGCLVSIGTGVTPPARLETGLNSASLLTMLNLQNLSRLPDLLRTLFRAATDSERTQEELARDARLLELNYFRFNVEAELGKVARYNLSGLETLRTTTDIYLQKPETENSLSFCALHLLAGYMAHIVEHERGLPIQASR